MQKTVLILECTFLLALTLSVLSYAGDAVSEANGKAEIIMGQVDGDHTGNLAGSYTMPLGTEFGAQFDGLLGRMDDDNLFGVGGHLFWRDSEKALLGLIGSYSRLGNADLWRFGAEGDVYWNDFTFSGQFGTQSGDLGEQGYGNLNACYYLLDDNMMVSAGGGYFDSKALFFSDVEYYTGLGGLSLFASGGVGQTRFDYIVGGVRYYFGAKKTLKLRHREDDPLNPLFFSLNETRPRFNSSPYGGALDFASTNGGSKPGLPNSPVTPD